MQSTGLLLTNPIVRKVAKCEEVGAKDHVTYKGIAQKVGFFFLFNVIGIALFFVLKEVGAATGVSDITMDDGFVLALGNIKSVGLIAFLPFLIVFCLSPILTAIFKFAVPVNGALYCAATGYIIAFVAYAVVDYRVPIFLAFFLTLALFIALAIIYSTGKIKVSQKFKTAFFGILLASVLFSIILLVLNFIPALKFIPQFFLSNSIFGIIFSVIGLIIAVIFVIVDFSVIQDAVDRQLPKRYEWFCAYALVFSFIYLYFKILDIVLKVMGKSKSK